MQIYVTHSVAEAILKYEKKSSYSNLRLLFYEYITARPTLDSWRSGTVLNRSVTCPFVKGRIGGRGGYRIYYLFLIKDEDVIISAVYPKFGSMSISSLGEQARDAAYSESYMAFKSRDMHPITLDHNARSISF